MVQPRFNNFKTSVLFPRCFTLLQLNLPVVLVDDDDVGVTVLDGLTNDLLEGGVLPPHWLRVRDHSVQLLDERNRFLLRKILKIKLKFLSN
jgi:hypothetical protein